jgi:uncharacterized protein (TIRG00374 family)
MVLTPRALLRALIGIAISVVSLYLVLRSVDLGQALDVARSATPAWLALAVVLIGVDVSCRAIRWYRLLAPIAPVPFRAAYASLLVGYLANNVLPARLGELVRSHDLGVRTGLSRATTLGTVVVERVVDTVFLVGVASVAILVLSIRGVVASAVIAGLAVAGVLVVGLIFGMAAHRLPGAERVIAFFERWPRIRELGSRLRSGLSVAARPRTLVQAVLLTAAAWSATILVFAAVGQSIGLQLRIADAALLASGVALATAIPSGPGYLGTFELAAVTIGDALGIPADQAFALALLVHAMVLILTSVGGAIALFRRGTVSSLVEAPASGVEADGRLELLEPPLDADPPGRPDPAARTDSPSPTT